ncbi:hypothetical protein ACE02P_17865 [Shewanella bicestrii]|jgi:hypothetical protein
MIFIVPESLSDLDWQWIRRFRSSKCLKTLDIQMTGAERRISENSHLTLRQRFENLTAINVAFCLREIELLDSKFDCERHRKRN